MWADLLKGIDMTTSLPAKAGLLIAAMTLAGAAMTAPAASAASTSGHAEVQRILDQAVAQSGAPGMVTEIRDGRERWFGSAGVSDTKTGQKRRPLERFRIGSATKAFTATVVLQLAAEGKLGLDDTVEEWLPGLVTGNGYDGRKITIRQLLNHTSGIFNYGNDPRPGWTPCRHGEFCPRRITPTSPPADHRPAGRSAGDRQIPAGLPAAAGDAGRGQLRHRYLPRADR
jgi:D-alanyl-D-alanine carboxypeptidase